jgi:hypothetical protein
MCHVDDTSASEYVVQSSTRRVLTNGNSAACSSVESGEKRRESETTEV